jgi:hypothetical protein
MAWIEFAEGTVLWRELSNITVKPSDARSKEYFVTYWEKNSSIRRTLLGEVSIR